MSAHGYTVIFIISFLIGIVTGFSSSYGSEIAVVSLCVFLVQGVLTLLYRYSTQQKNSKSSMRPVLPYIMMLVSLGLVMGIIRVQLMNEKNYFVCESACTFSGVVVRDTKVKGTYQTVYVQKVNEENTLLVLLRTPLYPKIKIGDHVEVTGKVTIPDMIYPHSDSKAFDYTSYLLSQGVGSEMMFPKITIETIGDESLYTHLSEYKESFIERINMYINGQASELSSGMLFGSNNLSEELKDMFRTAGLSHIVVLSGFNIAIMIAMVLLIFSFLPLYIRLTLAVVTTLFFVNYLGGWDYNSWLSIRRTCLSFLCCSYIFYYWNDSPLYSLQKDFKIATA